jgi:hypothetical protein
MPIYVFACEPCGIEVPEGHYPMDHQEPCKHCGKPMLKVPQPFHADAWGAPKWVGGIEQRFDSKSEWRRELRRQGLSEAGDRVGGARNEEHLNLGKGFSYAGQGSRKTSSEGSG